MNPATGSGPEQVIEIQDPWLAALLGSGIEEVPVWSHLDMATNCHDSQHDEDLKANWPNCQQEGMGAVLLYTACTIIQWEKGL